MNQPFILRTAKRQFKRLWGSNSTTELALIPMRRTSPSGLEPDDGYGALDTKGANLAKIIPFAQFTGTDKEMYMYVAGYSRTMRNTWDEDGQGIYIPSFICQVKFTWSSTSNLKGFDAGAWDGTTYTGAADLTADDILPDAAAFINGDSSIRVITDASTNAASITVDLEGAEFVAISFEDGGGTLSKPTNWNALVATF